jgi:rubrerythrin
MDILKQLGVRIKEETVELSGSAEVPEEDAEADDVDADTEKAVQSRVKEDVMIVQGDSWGCPKCGYVLLHPLVSVEFIICPKCGFEPYPEVKKKTFYDMLYRIIGKYKQMFPEEKIGEVEESEG